MRKHRRELLRMIERGRAIFPPEIRARLPEPELVVDALGPPWSLKARRARRELNRRGQEPAEDFDDDGPPDGVPDIANPS